MGEKIPLPHLLRPARQGPVAAVALRVTHPQQELWSQQSQAARGRGGGGEGEKLLELFRNIKAKSANPAGPRPPRSEGPPVPRRLPAAGGRREPGRAAQQHGAPSSRAIESPVHRSPRAAPAAPGPWEPPVPAARPRPPPTSRPEGEGNMAPARGGSEGGEKEKKIKGVQQKGRPCSTRAATTKTKGKQAEKQTYKTARGRGRRRRQALLRSARSCSCPGPGQRGGRAESRCRAPP